MSIMSRIFGTLNTQPTQQQQASPGNMPAVPALIANPTNPTAPLDTPTLASNTATITPTGLDAYSDMWKVAEGEGPKQPESPFAGVTQEQIAAIASKQDFSKVVTPEMMAAISAGGEGAVAATLQAMNVMAQKGHAESATATMRLIDVALAKQREEFTASLPSLVRNQNLSESLRTKNPIFNHPAAAPMLDMFKNQLQLKNPTASQEELQAKAEQFLVDFANTANPKKPNKTEIAANKQDDWSDFI